MNSLLNVSEWLWPFALLIAIHATVVSLFAIGLIRLFAKRSDICHAIGLGAIVPLLCSPLLWIATNQLPGWQYTPTIVHGAITRLTVMPGPLAAPSSVALSRLPLLNSDNSLGDSAPHTPQPADMIIYVPIALLGVWLTGTTLRFMAIVRSQFKILRLVSTAVPLGDSQYRLEISMAASILRVRKYWKVMISNRIASPVVIGSCRRPTILLPPWCFSTLIRRERVQVLVHEGAHAMRRDPAVLLAQQIVAAMFWWHPLIHLLGRLLTRSREELCDNYVLLHFDSERYAKTLLKVASYMTCSSNSPQLVGMSAARWPLEDRLRGMLDENRVLVARAPRVISVSAMVAFVAMGAFVIGSGKSSAQSPLDSLPSIELKLPQAADVAQQRGAGAVGARAYYPTGIYVMDANGQNLQLAIGGLVPGYDNVGSPCWSHDNKRIAFDAAFEGDWNKSHVFVVDVAGPSAGQVVDLGCGLIPSWSPNDEQIAFMLHPKNPNHEREGIWTMKADGSSRRRLTDGAMPAWSPKRNVIACVSGWAIPRDIFLVDVTSGAKTWMFPNGDVASKSRLAWWPDGDHLIFAPSAPRQDELFWIANIDRPQETLRALGRLPKDGLPISNWGYPAVSPDGNEVVFPVFSETAPTKSLCRLRVEPAGNPMTIALPQHITAPGNPAWSPDGKHLAITIH